MPRFETGVVVEVLDERLEVTRLTVEIDGTRRAATAFPQITGPIEPGDEVILNTTASELELGTGGEDFVLWNLSRKSAGEMSGGHILKLRYTPLQIDTLSVEAPESPYHGDLADAESVDRLPTVACGLHSQVAAVAATLKSLVPDCRIAYIMTDGAALPLAHSYTVIELRDAGLLDATLTCGHAFGGDHECVNIFSALAAARKVVGADAAIVSMGPGVVGTSTSLGHTEMEQGSTLSAATALGARAVATLRISFADPRPRHTPVSHHSLSALRLAAAAGCLLPVPRLEGEKMDAVMAALKASGIAERHQVLVVEAAETIDYLERYGLKPRTMGRGVSDDPEFFMAAGAAGVVAARILRGEM
jgi:hypothetical protein